jgi:hypothetical protein
MTPPRPPEAVSSGALPMSSPSVAERRAPSPSRGVPLLRAARRAVARLPHAAGSGTAGTFHSFWIALAGRIGKQERAAPTGDPLKNEEEMSMLNLIKNHRAEQEEPMFSAAHTSDARRAQAWLEAQFRRAEKTGGFTLDDVEITPVLAEVLLTCNTHNRAARRASIAKNRQAIKEGRWVAGASTIRFDTDRTIADGQHRLIAVIEEGRSITVDIRFGCSPKVRPVLDTHGKRSGSDVLGIAGNVNTAALAAAARLLYNCTVLTPRSNDGMDNDVCLEFVELHPGLLVSVLFGFRVNYALKCSTAAGSVAHYMIAESGAPSEAIELFFARVCDGLGLTSKRDPIYVLRETLREGGGGKAFIPLGAIINAWNCHKNGRKTQRVALQDGPFPAVEAWG